MVNSKRIGRLLIGTLNQLAKRVREHPRIAATGEWAELFAFELIRVAAVERDHDRARPGWQTQLATIAANAEHFREMALESLLNDRQELLKFGRPIPRLYTVGSPEQVAHDRQIYSELPPGCPYRLNGKIQRKRAA
jgi:hypothetical protein